MKAFQRILNYHKFPLLFLFSTWGVFFIYMFSRIISFKKEGLYLGHENLWSDWALHIAIANIFAFKDPSTWFSYHPLFAGGKFTYPFLSDFISGILIRTGLSLPLSFIIPSIITSFVFLLAFYFLFYVIFKSRTVPIIAISFFIFSSGLGFINFIFDLQKNSAFPDFLYPAIEYSRNTQYEWLAGNVAVGLLFPQRAFLLGLTLGLISILGLMYVLLRPNLKINYKRIILVLSGICAGLLTIAHPHSFIAIVFITGIICLINVRKLSEIIYFVTAAGIVSISLFLIFINGGIQTDSFFSLKPGWTSKDLVDFIVMWIKIFGITIPISLISFFLFIKNKQLSKITFFLPFFIIFIAANIFVFQPITWDNSKLFWWAYIGFCSLCAYFVNYLWNKGFIMKLLTIILIFFITATGVLEVARLVRIDKHNIMITNTDDINLGIRIRNETGPTDVFLTAPQHNNLVMVWGARPILLGYTAWVYNFGFNFQQREADLRLMYQGGEVSKQLLKKYNIKYVFIGSTELIDLQANEGYFSQNYPLAFSNENSRVYMISNIKN